MARHDEFDDEGFFEKLLNRKGKADMPPGLRRMLIIAAVLAVLAVLIAVLISAWPSGQEDIDNAAVPIIRAETTPFKVKPENPGGMNVPNKDSTIFETLKGEREESKIENLLEDNGDTASALAREEVVSKIESKSEPLTDISLEKTGQDSSKENPAELPPQPTAPKADEVDVKDVTEQDSKPVSVIEALKADSKPNLVSAPEPKPQPKSEVIKQSAVKTVTPGSGSTYIQLAAVKSEAEASGQWAKFKSRNPELSSLSMRTQRADLGAKGIFYRIQAGPLSAQEASQTCAAIKSRGGSCIIAK